LSDHNAPRADRNLTGQAGGSPQVAPKNPSPTRIRPRGCHPARWITFGACNTGTGGLTGIGSVPNWVATSRPEGALVRPEVEGPNMIRIDR